MTWDTVLKHKTAHPLRKIFMSAHFSFGTQAAGQGRRKYAPTLLTVALLQQIWNNPKAECQGSPDLISVKPMKVLQRAEMAEKVTRCLKHQDVMRTKELLSGGSGVERDMDPVSWSRTKLQCYRNVDGPRFTTRQHPSGASWPLVLHCYVAFWKVRFSHQRTLWQCQPCLWNKKGINLAVKWAEIMGLACGKRHDTATEAKKSQRQILVRPLEMIEEYPEHCGLNLLPCNCLSLDPSPLLTLILSEGLLCSCYHYLLKNKTKSTQKK